MKINFQTLYFLPALLISASSFAETPVFPPTTPQQMTPPAQTQNIPQGYPQNYRQGYPQSYPQYNTRGYPQQFPQGYPQAYPYAQGTRPGYPQMQMPQAMPQRAPQNYNQAMPQQQRQAEPQKPFREFSGYLGVAVDTLPSSVSAQLPKGNNQGVLVKEFAKDSPAINSDLKPFDVIVEFAGNKLSHPEQFIKMVRAGEPGSSVKMKIVRNGEIKDISVNLGAQKTPNPKEFNGLAIRQIEKNRYRAVIRFIGQNGNKQMRTYEGNREELHDQALNAVDLPPAERQQLLYATRPRNQKSNSGFGSFFPFGGTNESGKDWMNPRRFFKW